MWQGFTGWHALIILVVILLLFGAPKLPALARSLGQSMKILKSEVRSDKDEPAAADPAASGTPAPAANTAAPDAPVVTPKADEADPGSSR
jgi:sec-independent protein translocase protein TatA